MKNRLLIIFTFLSFVSFAQKDIPERPSPPRLVNDFVGSLLSNGEINTLEQKLRGYADSTSTQIVIVIAKDLNGYEPIEYAYKIGEKWGVGQQKLDNGIVLLWVPSDRKLAIATGQGVQGKITDGFAGSVIDKVIRPNFRELKYFKGLDDATTIIIKRLNGEFKSKKREGRNDEEDGVLGFFIFLIIIIIIISIIRRNNRGGGPPNRRYRDSGGGWIPYVTYGGWGSSSGGWGSSGGASSGGGGFDFGGFGGGGFDGGGASGDY